MEFSKPTSRYGYCPRCDTTSFWFKRGYRLFRCTSCGLRETDQMTNAEAERFWCRGLEKTRHPAHA